MNVGQVEITTQTIKQAPEANVPNQFKTFAERSVCYYAFVVCQIWVLGGFVTSLFVCLFFLYLPSCDPALVQHWVVYRLHSTATCATED